MFEHLEIIDLLEYLEDLSFSGFSEILILEDIPLYHPDFGLITKSTSRYRSNKDRKVYSRPHLLSSTKCFIKVPLNVNFKKDFFKTFSGDFYTNEQVLQFIKQIAILPNKGKTFMHNSSKILTANKQAAVTAAKLEVGGIALDLITDQLVKTLPEPFQTLAKSQPLTKMAVANLAQVLLLSSSVQDERLAIVVDAMLTKSYIDTLNSLDVTTMFTELLSKLPATSLKILEDD